MIKKEKKNILWFKELGAKDIPLVGGKNASLGEMYGNLSKKGVKIPNGFAITTSGYWEFMKSGGIMEELKEIFRKFNPESIKSLQETGNKARSAIMKGDFPDALRQEIAQAYKSLEKEYGRGADVAVRSSGVVEDAPGASFAGQFETFLNVRGEEDLILAVKKCFASSFNDRVIAYRDEKKFDQIKFALSVGVLKMVRSDLASSGVMFSLDTETGFGDVVLINSIWGVGEMIVKGLITPDEFYVFKPALKKGFKSIITKNLGRKSKKYVYGARGGLKEENVDKTAHLKFSLSDDEILTLAEWAVIIEEHYSRKFKKWMPQDIEWAKDGKTGELFIVQSRPETIHAPKARNFYEEYKIKSQKPPVVKGIAVGEKIGTGKVRVISDVSKIGEFKKGEVLVTTMTDPDWVPIMRIASAIVTNEGGKTAHAAIVSRELGIPAIVGTKNATEILKTGDVVTVDCTQGLNGRVYRGKIPFKIQRHDLRKIPKLKTKMMINIGAPEIALRTSFLPNDGVGLAREEFIIAEKIRVHPLALYHFERLKNKALKNKIGQITIEHKDKKEFFIKELAEGVSQIAAAFYPKEVIVRFSDFKTNEYRNLIGGELFEGEEENPMLGFRGASRYVDDSFKPAFLMECQAIKRARELFGLTNIAMMIPFCRTVEEGKKVLALMKENGLAQGEGGLKVYVMAEIPSNVLLADKFLEVFDGMSIGSNDLTQLVLGLDRDNAGIAHIGDERNEAVKNMIADVIKICRRKKKYIGICGEAPSTFGDFAQFLVENKIQSMSLNPGSIIKTILAVAEKEKANK